MLWGIDDLSNALLFDDDIFDELFNFKKPPQHLPPWKQKPMVQWSAAEVVNFIETEVVELYSISINIHRFECISGYIFISLEEEYCQILAESERLGSTIFKVKENYVKLNPPKEEDYHFANKENDDNGESKPKKLNIARFEIKNRRRSAKSEKLWGFLMNLLKEGKTELIKWENYKEGTFKFVNADNVARLWGSRNHNPTMNYEKFTRALRYHYKNKVLLPVPEKRYVYKFGPHAKGWKNTLQCC